MSLPGNDFLPGRLFKIKMSEYHRLLAQYQDRIYYKEDHWIWTGAIVKSGNKKYGRVQYKNQSRLVHRLLFAFYNNLKYLDPFLACHKPECNISLCINPEHIYIGDYNSNSQDAVKLGTHNSTAKTHCPQNHEYNEFNTRINKRGARECIICNRAKCKRYRNRPKIHRINK